MEQPSEVPTRSGRRWERLVTLAPSAAALLVAAAGGALVVWLRARNSHQESVGVNWWLIAWLVVGAAYGAIGAAFVVRRRFRVLGVLFLVVALAGLLAAISTQYQSYLSAFDGPGAPPLLAGAADRAWALGGSVLVSLVPWRLESVRPARPVPGAPAAQVTAIVGIAVLTVLGARDLAGAADPTAVEHVAGWTIGILGLVAIVGQWRRWEPARVTGDPLAVWLVAGTAAAWLAVVPWLWGLTEGRAGEAVVPPLLLLATVPLLGFGSLVQLVRASQQRPDRLSPAVLEWSMLGLAIVLLYTVLVAGLGTLLGGNGPIWLLVLTTGAVALTIEPARRRLRRLADHMVYGSRNDPLALVQSIVDRVQSEPGEELLPSLVRQLAGELRLDVVGIDLSTPDGWVRAAVVGDYAVHERELLLRHHGEIVGRLVVGWTHGPSMRARDAAVLEQLSGALAMAVSWVRLAVELRRSGMAVVAAREEERRRLRRDLHDGVGPALTGISLGLHTAVKRLDRAGAADEPTRALLVCLSDEIDAVVVEIKRIARDLRPTTLDELGLVGAITEFTRRFSDELDIELSLARCPNRLPAVVEVAVYRIVTEAITNVVRHAAARRCSVSVAAADDVEIDVVDDGIGIEGRASDGVGLTAMRERAVALGGVMRLDPAVPRGTHLRVRLPVAVA